MSTSVDDKNLNGAGLYHLISLIKTALNGKANSDHTHTTVNGYTIVISSTEPASGTPNTTITFVKRGS